MCDARAIMTSGDEPLFRSQRTREHARASTRAADYPSLLAGLRLRVQPAPSNIDGSVAWSQAN